MRRQIITVSGLSGAVYGSRGVCPGLGGAVAGMCTLFLGLWYCPWSLHPSPGTVYVLYFCIYRKSYRHRDIQQGNHISHVFLIMCSPTGQWTCLRRGKTCSAHCSSPCTTRVQYWEWRRLCTSGRAFHFMHFPSGFDSPDIVQGAEELSVTDFNRPLLAIGWLKPLLGHPWPLPLCRDLLSQVHRQIFHPHLEQLALWAWSHTELSQCY